MDKDLRKMSSELLFCLGLVCELFVAPSGYLTGGYGEKYTIFFGMVCFALSLAFSMELKKDWKLFLPLFLFAGGCYLVQHSALILRIVLILLAGREMDRKKVMKLFFIGTGITIVTAIVLSFSGAGNPLYVDDRFRHFEERRFCFGFLHPNSFMFFWVRLLLFGAWLYLDAYIDRPRGLLWIWVPASVFCLAPVYLGGSKIGLALTLLMLSILLYLRLDKKKERRCKLLFAGGSLAMGAELLLIGSLFVVPWPVEYKWNLNTFWGIANELTTGRLRHAKRLLNESSFQLLGSQQFGNVSEIGFIDSLYREGLVFLLLYLVLLVLLWLKLYKEKDEAGMLLCLIFTLYALAESFLPYVNKNGVWLLFIACPGILPQIRGRAKKEVADEKNTAH